jgi:orotate phosphoribosyltransferase
VQDDFNHFIIEHGVIGFFEAPITLKSGRSSYWYVNWRTVSEDAFLLVELSGFVERFILQQVAGGAIPALPDTVFGVPEGATKVALLTQLALAQRSPEFSPGSHVLAMGRGKPKEHGVPKDKYFLGLPRGLTVVVEDVTTTGGSLISCLGQLTEAGVKCPVAIGLTNRMEKRDDGLSVAEALKALSPPVNYLHMSDATQLLPLAAAKAKASGQVLKSIEEDFARHGVRSVKF